MLIELIKFIIKNNIENKIEVAESDQDKKNVNAALKQILTEISEKKEIDDILNLLREKYKFFKLSELNCSKSVIGCLETIFINLKHYLKLNEEYVLLIDDTLKLDKQFRLQKQQEERGPLILFGNFSPKPSKTLEKAVNSRLKLGQNQ